MTPQISIIIPIHGEAPFLRRTLNSIAKQEAAPSYEIILVDNNARVDFQLMRDEFKLKVFRCAPRGAAAARNLGISKANAPHLVFIDADVVLDRNWLRIIHNHLKKKWADCVQTPIIPACDSETFMQKFRTRYISEKTHGTYSYLTQAERGFPILNSAAFGLRKSILRRNSIRFDESLLRCEDLDFGYQLFIAGCNFILTADSKAHVFDNRQAIDYLKRSYRNGVYTSHALANWGGLTAKDIITECRRSLRLKRLEILELYTLAIKLQSVVGLVKGHLAISRAKNKVKARHSYEAAHFLTLRNELLLNFSWLGNEYRLSPYSRIILLKKRLILFNLATRTRLVVRGQESVGLLKLLETNAHEPAGVKKSNIKIFKKLLNAGILARAGADA
jgi:glycosyltransferase involved in cell wall biosynthesis